MNPIKGSTISQCLIFLPPQTSSRIVDLGAMHLQNYPTPPLAKKIGGGGERREIYYIQHYPGHYRFQLPDVFIFANWRSAIPETFPDIK